MGQQPMYSMLRHDRTHIEVKFEDVFREENVIHFERAQTINVRPHPMKI